MSISERKMFTTKCIHQGIKKCINEALEPLLQNFEMAVRFISAFLNAILA